MPATQTYHFLIIIEQGENNYSAMSPTFQAVYRLNTRIATAGSAGNDRSNHVVVSSTDAGRMSGRNQLLQKKTAIPNKHRIAPLKRTLIDEVIGIRFLKI